MALLPLFWRGCLRSSSRTWPGRASTNPLSMSITSLLWFLELDILSSRKKILSYLQICLDLPLIDRNQLVLCDLHSQSVYSQVWRPCKSHRPYASTQELEWFLLRRTWLCPLWICPLATDGRKVRLHLWSPLSNTSALRLGRSTVTSWWKGGQIFVEYHAQLNWNKESFRKITESCLPLTPSTWSDLITTSFLIDFIA